MTKEELFKKYHINNSHAHWNNQIDAWVSVEIYRLMHEGNLPPDDDTSTKWITDFLDKTEDINWWSKNVMTRKDWGSLYLTAKRLCYHHYEQIIEEMK